MDTYIYSLSCPITNEIRYIGKTNNMKKRFNQHLSESKKNRNYKNNWIKSLKTKKLIPLIEEVDCVNESNWEFWEKHYISLYKSWGFRLVNQDEGGKGCPGGKPSWNSGKKVGVTWNKGVSPSIETRLKISASLKGNKPWNTGTNGIKPPNAGSFKKGDVPKNKNISKINIDLYKELIIKYNNKEINLKHIMKSLSISYTTLYKLNKKYN